MNTTRVIAAHGDMALVKHDPQGEIRIEHAESGTCSDWLHHSDVERIKADPNLMTEWNLDCNMEEEANLVRVVYWSGTTQREAEVSSYTDAMIVIAKGHRNAHDVAFYEISTGRQLYDDGNGLCVEDRSYYVCLNAPVRIG